MVIRRVAIEAGAAVVALACAFGSGRHSVKPVIHETVRVETQTRDVVRTVVQHDVQASQAVRAKVRTVTITRWLAPDGVPVATQEVRQDAQQDSHATQASETHQEASHVADARQAAQETRTVTTEAARPNWSLTALAGAQWGGHALVPGLPSPWVVGAVVEHRFIGPISAGLWATSSAAGGVSVRAEF